MPIKMYPTATFHGVCCLEFNLFDKMSRRKMDDIFVVFFMEIFQVLETQNEIK